MSAVALADECRAIGLDAVSDVLLSLRDDSPLWRTLLTCSSTPAPADDFQHNCLRAFALLLGVVDGSLPPLGSSSRGSPAASLHAPSAMKFIAESAVIQFDLVVSGAAFCISIPVQQVWDMYVPLAVLCVLPHRGSSTPAVVGVVAPAGTGKSTLCAIVAAVATPLMHCLDLCECEEAITRTVLARAAQSLTGPAPILTLSMDAYHVPNAVLASSGLTSYKGRIDTINGTGFAADLEALRSVAWVKNRASSGHAAVGSESWAEGIVCRLPVYDRAVTHDPIPGAVPVHCSTRGILVEGLYLCNGGTTTNTSSPSFSVEAQAAWARVRRQLDLVVYLHMEDATCRARVVARKAVAGVPHADASASYDRVDFPTRLDVEASVARPGCVSIEREGGQWSCSTVSQGTGADIFVHLATPLPTSDALVTCRSVEVRGFPSLCSQAAATAAVEPFLQRRVVVVGLNPCVQRTLVFAPACGAGSKETESKQAAWSRGGVNRASSVVCAVGGKGQHCAIALLRNASFQPAASADVTLLQYAGGATGRDVERYLGDACALTHAPECLPACSVVGCTTPTPTPAPNQLLHLETVWLDDASPTRMCTTLLDMSLGEMTELIEPSAAIPHAQQVDLHNKFISAISTPTVASESAPRLGVALMGTAPPGGKEHPRDFSRALASEGGTSTLPPFVLLDISTNAIEIVAAGGITMLKVNATELGALVAAVDKSEAATAAEDCSLHPVFRHSITLFQHLAIVPRFQYVCITDGPGAAFLVERHLSTASETPRVCGVTVTQYTLPALSAVGAHVVNPIGAGDTVAGTLLWHVLGGADVRDAVAWGLAAGSASCATLTGALWSADVASAVHTNMSSSTSSIWLA